MVCFVIGSITIIGQMDTFGDALDPQRNNIGSIDAGSEDQKLMNVEESGCYRAYGVNFKGTVTLSEVNGSDVQDEVEESKCKLDWGAMSADGSVEYTVLGSWELVEGDHLMRIDCESGCANETVWLTSIDTMEGDILNSPMVYVGGSLCCLGIFLLPLAGVLQAFSQNRKQNLMMVVGPDGQLMPLTDLTPEIVQDQINNMNQGATEGVGFDVRTGEYKNKTTICSSKWMVQGMCRLVACLQRSKSMHSCEVMSNQQLHKRSNVSKLPTRSLHLLFDKRQRHQLLSERAWKQPDRKIPIANNEDWQSWDED